MVQENPQEIKEPSQKFFRTPVQKIGCRTYEEAKSFANQAFAAAEKLNPGVSKAKVFARNNGLFDAVLYVDKAKADAQQAAARKAMEKAFNATPEEMGRAAVKAAKANKSHSRK